MGRDKVVDRKLKKRTKVGEEAEERKVGEMRKSASKMVHQKLCPHEWKPFRMHGDKKNLYEVERCSRCGKVRIVRRRMLYMEDAEFERWRSREYLKPIYDEYYRASADGRTRAEWARDKARDDRINRADVEEDVEEVR